MRFAWPLPLLALLAPFAALAASPVLPAPTSRLEVEAGITGGFEPIRAFVGSYNSRVDAEYWFAIVRSCGGNPVAYADQLFDAWAPRLSPVSHALIVICQEEQSMGAHTGTAYSFLGMDGATLATQLSTKSQLTTPIKNFPAETARLAMSEADDLLAQSLRARVKARSEAVETLTRAEADLLAAQKALKEARAVSPIQAPAGFAEGQAEQRLAEAKRWLEASPRDAQSIAEELSQQSQAAKEKVKSALAAAAALVPKAEALRSSLSALRQRFPITGGEDKAVQDAALAIELALKDYDDARAAGEYDAAAAALRRGEALVTLGEEAAREGEIIARHRVVYLPLWLLVTAALAALIAAIGFRAVAAAWSRRAQSELDVYASRLADLQTRLEALRARQPSLLEGPELHARLIGQTLSRYESAGEKYDRVTAMLGRAKELMEKASAAAREKRLFSTTASQKVLHLLQDGSCIIAYGPSASKDVVMLRTLREHALPTARLLDEIALSLPEAAKELDELGAVVKEARPAAEQSKAGVKAAQALYQELGGLGVTPASAQVELAGLESASVSLESDVSRDPLAVVSQARVIQEAAQTIAKRLSAALALARRACQELPTQGRALWVKVYELRQQGYKLREAAFEPEIHKERLDRALSSAVGALNALDLDHAERDLAQADEAIAALRDGIKVSVQARETGPKEEAALRAKHDALVERLSQERPALERITSRGDGARDLVEQFDRVPAKLNRAAQLLTESERRAQESFYLAAAERRTQASQQLKAIEELLTEVHDRDKLEAMGIDASPVRRPKGVDSSPKVMPISPPVSNLRLPALPKLMPSESTLKATRGESSGIMKIQPPKPSDSNVRLAVVPKLSPSETSSKQEAAKLPPKPAAGEKDEKK